MKKDIHPTYYPDAQVTCACGNTWTTGSTQQVIRTDICSNCHPFYTGEQRIVDTEGQVDRFYKRLEARTQYLQEQKEAAASQVDPERPLAELDLGKRALDACRAAGTEKPANSRAKREAGNQAILDLDGIGRKTLADTKKGLRRLGYEVP